MFMDIDSIASIKSSRVNRKIVHTNLVFLMLLTEKYPEIFPKHKKYFFISGSFALNLYIFLYH